MNISIQSNAMLYSWMEDKLSKGGNYKRFKKESKPEYGNSGPEIFVHPPFKISGSAPVPCFFLTNVQTFLIFDTLFAGTVRPKKFKLGTLVDSVYQNQATAIIYPFISSFFFLSNYQTTLFSRTVRPRNLKLGTHLDNRCMYHVRTKKAAAAYLSHYWSIFLSFQFSVTNLSLLW